MNDINSNFEWKLDLEKIKKFIFRTSFSHTIEGPNNIMITNNDDQNSILLDYLQPELYGLVWETSVMLRTRLIDSSLERMYYPYFDYYSYDGDSVYYERSHHRFSSELLDSIFKTVFNNNKYEIFINTKIQEDGDEYTELWANNNNNKYLYKRNDRVWIDHVNNLDKFIHYMNRHSSGIIYIKLTDTSVTLIAKERG